VTGLGPHGEFAIPADQLTVSDEAAARASSSRFSVALVLHTTHSDWSKLQVAGITSTLQRYGADLVDIADCGFRPERQVLALEALVERRPDAIISIPVDNRLAADAHRRLSEAAIKLVLMDNAPLGMVAGKDYVSVVSADNFGNGEIAAEILSGHIPAEGTACVVGYSADFYVTNERDLGFRKWLREHRPDVRLTHVGFDDPEAAGEAVLADFAAGSTPDALFVVWDEPALAVARALREAGRPMPMTTVDLGSGIALEIARGELVKGAGAQLPFDQGEAEAMAAIIALAGDEPPAWIALPALAVTRDNVIDAYQAVWHEPAPPSLREALAAGGARP
jgi:ribose transport system substrate-binding protein